jgi:DNA-binding Lrp family transcriptional regulator
MGKKGCKIGSKANSKKLYNKIVQWKAQGLSNNRIAAKTGLTRQAIDFRVKELLKAGLLKEVRVDRHLAPYQQQGIVTILQPVPRVF